MTELSEYLIEEGYSKTNLYNDPSGASMSADTHLDDINRVALKLYNYDFVKECVGKSTFSIQTPQGEFTWKNTNKFLDKKSPYYNENVKGIKQELWHLPIILLFFIKRWQGIFDYLLGIIIR